MTMLFFYPNVSFMTMLFLYHNVGFMTMPFIYISSPQCWLYDDAILLPNVSFMMMQFFLHLLPSPYYRRILGKYIHKFINK